MNWDDLRIFLAIADKGSLAGAARQLRVNHSTVFRRLNAIEDDLKVRLFERLPRGYVLTAAGEEMTVAARRVEADVADIERQNYDNLLVVSPDIGGVVRARAIAKQLNTELAIIDKRRPEANQTQVMNVIGEVEDRTCLLVDDIVDTAGTLCKAADALKQHGATKVVAYCTHPVLSGPAVDNLNESDLDELVVTNSIPLNERTRSCARIRQLSISATLGEAIRRVSNEESISAMFD
jgi:ribose-phosphate pyrophosphokinase